MNSIENTILKYPFSLLLAVLGVMLIQVLYGFYWEDTMTVHPAVIYGCISSPPYSVWFDEVLLFQVPVLAFLSAYLDKIPVVGIWQFLIIILYISLWFHLSIRILHRLIKGKPWLIILLSFLFVWSVVGIALVYVHFSRASILLTAASILVYLDYYQAENRKPFFFLLLFLLGCMVRLSTGILVLAAMTILVILHIRSLKTTFRLLKSHWFFAALFLTVVLINKYATQNIAHTIEQAYEYALTDRKAIVPISEMKSKEDSVRYEALTGYFFINDTAQISLDFVKSIIENRKEPAMGINGQDIIHLSSTLLPVMKKYKLFILLFYLLLCAAAWNSRRQTIINIIAINFFSWIILIVLAMKISMPERFLLPWFCMLSGSSLFLALQKEKLAKWQSAVLLTLLLLLAANVAVNLEKISREEEEYNTRAYASLKKIEALSRTSVPVIWDYFYLCFPSDIFSRKELSAFKSSIYLTDFFILYYEFGQKRCLEKFGFSPLDWRKMNKVFHDNRDKLTFIAQDRTAEFLGIYYQTLYHLDFVLVKELPVNEVTPEHYVFHLQAR